MNILRPEKESEQKLRKSESAPSFITQMQTPNIKNVSKNEGENGKKGEHHPHKYYNFPIRKDIEKRRSAIIELQKEKEKGLNTPIPQVIIKKVEENKDSISTISEGQSADNYTKKTNVPSSRKFSESKIHHSK